MKGTRMTKTLLGVSLGILFGLALIGPVGAQEASGISLGTHIMGPKLTADDLKGRVILFEVWGIN
jgi:hypothetical protein